MRDVEWEFPEPPNRHHALVAAQVNAVKFHRFLFWATIVATTTLGTTIADFADRSLGIGYPGGVAIVLSLLLASLAIWYWVEGAVSVQSITSPRVEWFYWCTILFSQTLGTALGDWVAGSDRGGLGLGYEYGAIIFGIGLAMVALMGLGPLGIAFVLWDVGMKRGDPRLLGTLAFATPVLSTVLLGAGGMVTLSPVVLLAAGLVAAGGLIASRG